MLAQRIVAKARGLIGAEQPCDAAGDAPGNAANDAAHRSRRCIALRRALLSASSDALGLRRKRGGQQSRHDRNSKFSLYHAITLLFGYARTPNAANRREVPRKPAPPLHGLASGAD